MTAAARQGHHGIGQDATRFIDDDPGDGCTLALNRGGQRYENCNGNKRHHERAFADYLQEWKETFATLRSGVQILVSLGRSARTNAAVSRYSRYLEDEWVQVFTLRKGEVVMSFMTEHDNLLAFGNKLLWFKLFSVEDLTKRFKQRTHSIAIVPRTTNRNIDWPCDLPVDIF